MGEMAKFERLKTEEPLESRKSRAQQVKDTADDIGTKSKRVKIDWHKTTTRVKWLNVQFIDSKSF